MKDLRLIPKFFLILFILLFSSTTYSQNSVERYNIGEIKVSGNTSFSPLTIVTFSGLREGDAIIIPGEKLSNAIKNYGVQIFLAL